MLELQNRLNKFDGTHTLEWDLSTGTEDLIADFTLVTSSSVAGKIAYQFEFKTAGDTLVSINGSLPILVGAKDELELNTIWSFKILTAGVRYRYFAQY